MESRTVRGRWVPRSQPLRFWPGACRPPGWIFGRTAPGACPGIAAAAGRRNRRAGCGTRPPVAGGSHFAPTKPHCAPSPSRTRVFPSSAIDNWSKSETSEVDMGEGWGEGYLFDSADRHPPPGSRAESARHSDASHRVLSRTAAEARLCLPHKGGGNRSERLRLPSARGDDIPAPGPSERAMNKAKDKGVKARLPRGFADRAAAEIFATRRMLERIREVFERYGFESVETPAIEYTDVLGKFLPDQDRPGEGVFSFQDDDEQWLSLRYDLTAPLARYVAENFEKLPKPYRSYRVGWVFRNEKPGPGRYRQFMQFDADTVGAASMAADAEMCMMAADTMEALGIPRGSYVVKVSNRKILDGVMETIELGGDENYHRRLTVLRAIDKLERLGLAGVQQLLGTGRKDESGDFTKGAELNQASIATILSVFEPVSDSGDRLAQLDTRLKDSRVGRQGTAELESIASLVRTAGYGDGRIIIDPSVVRGLEYYTGPVYEVDLTFETKDDVGRPVRFGSVGGGGRYDGLIARFRGESVPATGVSIGGLRA